MRQMMPDAGTAQPLFLTHQPLILASGSPRRRDFLQDMGIPCRVMPPPDGAEPQPFAGETPQDFAARSAKAKADAVFALCREPGAAVLAADTVVYQGGKIYGKPGDFAEALIFLKELAGKTHCVRTACHLYLESGKSVIFHGEAAVHMADWPDAVLRAYANSGEGLDKAGAYAVQGLGAFLVTSVTGSWSSVIGLPATETVAVLLEHGILGLVRHNAF